MFDKFVADHRKASDITAEMSMELMTAPMMDEERTRLDQVKRELDEEREKFTQAAIKLGRERAALEVSPPNPKGRRNQLTCICRLRGLN